MSPCMLLSSCSNSSVSMVPVLPRRNTRNAWSLNCSLSRSLRSLFPGAEVARTTCFWLQVLEGKRGIDTLVLENRSKLCDASLKTESRQRLSSTGGGLLWWRMTEFQKPKKDLAIKFVILYVLFFSKFPFFFSNLEKINSSLKFWHLKCVQKKNVFFLLQISLRILKDYRAQNKIFWE